MNEAKSQGWYQLYASAVVKLDHKKLIQRVDAAAIHGRLRDLQYDSDHHEERQLIEDAQRTLGFLRLLSLNDPAPSIRRSCESVAETINDGGEVRM